jgi:hypothetical protein
LVRVTTTVLASMLHLTAGTSTVEKSSKERRGGASPTRTVKGPLASTETAAASPSPRGTRTVTVGPLSDQEAPGGREGDMV